MEPALASRYQEVYEPINVFCKVSPSLCGYWKPFGLLAMTLPRRFFERRDGATAIEYGLIAAGISLAIISIYHGSLNPSPTASDDQRSLNR